MSSLEEHCEDCIRELGKPYKEVHLWLDELFKKLGPKHRSVRHHEGGVEEVREKFGDDAAKAAEIHIKKDCLGIVPTREQAEMWCLFGPPGITLHGESYLTDEPVIVEYAKDMGTEEMYVYANVDGEIKKVLLKDIREDENEEQDKIDDDSEDIGESEESPEVNSG